VGFLNAIFQPEETEKEKTDSQCSRCAYHIWSNK
jgi:hypothetical protein